MLVLSSKCEDRVILNIVLSSQSYLFNNPESTHAEIALHVAEPFTSVLLDDIMSECGQGLTIGLQGSSD